MDIKDIRYFLVVAKELNITRAATKLNIAQPPLSRQIQHLEEELGVRLFNRDKKKITLTEEGKLLRQRGEQLIALMEKTEAEVKELANGINGTLYIGTVEGRGPYLISQWIAKFCEKYPQVYYEIWNGTTDDVVDRLDKGLLDVALIMEPFNKETMDSIIVDKVPWIAMLNNDSPLAKQPGDTIDVVQLENVPIIIPSRKYRVGEITSWFEEAGIKPDLHCQMSSYLNARELTMQGIGAAIFPSTTGCDRKNNWVTEKRIVNPERIATYALVWDKRKKPSAIAERFIDLVKALPPVEE